MQLQENHHQDALHEAATRTITNGSDATTTTTVTKTVTKYGQRTMMDHSLACIAGLTTCHQIWWCDTSSCTKATRRAPATQFPTNWSCPTWPLSFLEKDVDASRAKHPDESYTSGPMGLQQPNFIHIITVAILLINMGEPGMSPGKYYIHIREKRQTFKI